MSKISIVMPVYNSEKYLRNCLDSIFNQTFKDFELICVNDGSTDNSLNILNEYCKLHEGVMKVINQNNKGSGAARNYGFSFVKSENVIFLDSDDVFYPNFFEKMYGKFLETNADIVICRYNVVLPDGSSHQQDAGIYSEILPQKQVFNKKNFPQYIFNFVNYAIWNKLIKTDLVRQNNIRFDNIPNNNDVYFTLSVLLNAESITTIDETLLQYNFFNENSATVNRKKFLNVYVFDIFKRLKKQIGDDKLLEKSLNNAYISTVIYTLNFLKGNKRREFLKLIKANVPLPPKKDVHKKNMYYEILCIKKLPPDVYILLYKIRCTVRRFFSTIIKTLNLC